MTQIIVSDKDVYDDIPEYDWKTYQKGFLGILNNAYNQSCNAGTKILGDMSEIRQAFETGSFEEFCRFYYTEKDGIRKRERAINRMATNLVERVESVGGTLSKSDAITWAEQYIDYMIANSYRGLMDESFAIEKVADERGESWSVAGPSKESAGIDGYIGGTSVQVKPESYSSLAINDYSADAVIWYSYTDSEFVITFSETLK